MKNKKKTAQPTVDTYSSAIEVSIVGCAHQPTNKLQKNNSVNAESVLGPHGCYSYAAFWMIGWPKPPTKAPASPQNSDYQSITASEQWRLLAGIKFKKKRTVPIYRTRVQNSRLTEKKKTGYDSVAAAGCPGVPAVLWFSRTHRWPARPWWGRFQSSE